MVQQMLPAHGYVSLIRCIYQHTCIGRVNCTYETMKQPSTLGTLRQVGLITMDERRILKLRIDPGSKTLDLPDNTPAAGESREVDMQRRNLPAA